MPASPSRPPGRVVARAVSAFGRFWWEFLVGDTPELFVGMLVVLAVAAGLAGAGAVAWILVPLTVIAVLATSVVRGTRGG